MAEQTKVPGIGDVPKPVLYGTVGIAGAFVLYRWWTRKSTPAAPVAPDPQDLGAANYAGTGSSSAPVNAVNPNSGPGTFASNADWTQYAADKLSASGGWDPGTILVALGKYLAHQGLSDAEIQIVTAAKGVAGDPPLGGPYQIIHALPTPDPGPTSGRKLPPPTGLFGGSGMFNRVNGQLVNNYVDWGWNAVDGADHYHWEERSAFGSRSGDVKTPGIHETGLTAPNADHYLTVWAVDASGARGEPATTVAHTHDNSY
jgi:hypothetical protein